MTFDKISNIIHEEMTEPSTNDPRQNGIQLKKKKNWIFIIHLGKNSAING